MFRIAFMAEDRKLADVLRSVAGRVHNLEVVPVVIGNDKPKAAAKKPKQTLTKKRNRLRRDISPSAFGFSAGHKFHSSDLVKPLAAMGMSKNSGWYCIMRMLKEKTIRRVGVGEYEAV